MVVYLLTPSRACVRAYVTATHAAEQKPEEKFKLSRLLCGCTRASTANSNDFRRCFRDVTVEEHVVLRKLESTQVVTSLRKRSSALELYGILLVKDSFRSLVTLVTQW